MKQYKDLTEAEKRLFNTIEGIFLNSCVGRANFVKVLGVLINKLKIRKKK